jgi:hypothetical protein
MPEAMPARCGSTTPTAAVAGAGNEEAGQERSPVVARLEPAHQQQPDPHAREPAAHEPADADALRELAGDRRHEERQQRHGQEAQAGLERRVAEDVLDVEGQVQEHREHRRRQRERGDRGAVERRLAEQREVEHRVVAAELDQHEGDEEHDRGGEADEDQRAVPAFRVAADEPEDQREQAAGKRDEPRPVDARAARRLRLLDLAQRERDRDDPDRQVDEEDRLPADAVGQHTADERPDRHRGACDRAPDAECGSAVAALVGGGEQGQRGREHERAADPLQRA